MRMACVWPLRRPAKDDRMQLLGRTIIALRILVSVARSRGRLVRAKDICADLSESRQHIVKVVYELSLGGFLETVRGHGGGVRLASEPWQTRVGDVVAYMEALEDKRSTARKAACPDPKRTIEPDLEAAISISLDNFIGLLNTYTIDDFARRGGLNVACAGADRPSDTRSEPPLQLRHQ